MQGAACDQAGLLRFMAVSDSTDESPGCRSVGGSLTCRPFDRAAPCGEKFANEP
jgi:hypothetical protein